MKISILLPYKENFSPNYAGAVSLFVNDITKISKYKDSICVYGSTTFNKKFPVKYHNLNLPKSFTSSLSKSYIEEFVSDISKIDLEENDITKHQDAKSRWIMQGFTDPDIAFLNRTVPTPASEDLMLALQLIASIQGEAGISDVSSAFGQSIQGLLFVPTIFLK